MVVDIDAENEEGGHVYSAPTVHTARLSLKGTWRISFSYFYYLIKTPHVGIEKKWGIHGGWIQKFYRPIL